MTMRCESLIVYIVLLIIIHVLGNSPCHCFMDKRHQTIIIVIILHCITQTFLILLNRKEITYNIIALVMRVYSILSLPMQLYYK